MVLYTDGSASLASGSAGWEIYLTRAPAPPASLWEPVITERSDPDWIGALCLTNNTGYIIAHCTIPLIGFVPRWDLLHARSPVSKFDHRRMSTVRLGDNSIKARLNEAAIQRVRRLLQDVRAHDDIAIFWIKVDKGGSSPAPRAMRRPITLRVKGALALLVPLPASSLATPSFKAKSCFLLFRPSSAKAPHVPRP